MMASTLLHKRAKEALTMVRGGIVVATAGRKATGTRDKLHNCGVLGSLIWQMEAEGLVEIRTQPRERVPVRLTEAGVKALAELGEENSA